MVSHNRSGDSVDLQLPSLPNSSTKSTSSSESIINPHHLTRKKLKLILHLITAELKHRGTKTPHIFLPFRSRIDDTKLEIFLRRIFPNGDLIPINNKDDEHNVKKKLKNFDEFTLICSLKYLWSRLPNNEIIGWDVYLEYKRREKEAGYPRNAFLSIMPKCLSSPAHASIVYDFLDILISIASNSQYNYLSGRKIAKMSSLWAFNGYSKHFKSAFFDATLDKEFNFIEGLESWKSSSDALFHLLLSFLRAMLPDNEADTLKLPKTLQSLLITNSYPPAQNSDSIKSIITIPCVCVKSTKRSKNAYDLLSKVKKTLSFDKKDSFLSIENYTILKNIFRKDSTDEIVDTLTEESRRILNRITADPIDSEYGLYPGWAKPPANDEVDDDSENIPLYSQISIHDVSLQDYYIWTWLSSLGSDQTSHIKRLFGRSLVVEAGLRGFQKWLIVTEEQMSPDEYIRHFKTVENDHPNYHPSNREFRPSVPEKDRAVSNGSYKDMPLPPPPLPSKDDNSLLPNYEFDETDHRIDVGEMAAANNGAEEDEEDYYVYPSQVNGEASDDYTKYLQGLNEQQDESLANAFNQKASLTHTKSTSSRHRRPPPPMDLQEPPQPPVASNDYHPEPPVPEKTPFYSTSSGGDAFKEPYEDYETDAEKAARLKQLQVSEEPFDNYYIPGIATKNDHKQQPSNPLPSHEEYQPGTAGEQYLPPVANETLSPQRDIQDGANLSATSPETSASSPMKDEEKEERRRKRKEKKERKRREEAEQAAMYPYNQFGYFPQGPPPGYPPIMDPNGSFDNMGLPPPGFLSTGMPSQMGMGDYGGMNMPGEESTSPKKSKDPNRKKDKKKKKKDGYSTESSPEKPFANTATSPHQHKDTLPPIPSEMAEHDLSYHEQQSHVPALTVTDPAHETSPIHETPVSPPTAQSQSYANDYGYNEPVYHNTLPPAPAPVHNLSRGPSPHPIQTQNTHYDQGPTSAPVNSYPNVVHSPNGSASYHGQEYSNQPTAQTPSANLRQSAPVKASAQGYSPQPFMSPPAQLQELFHPNQQYYGYPQYQQQPQYQHPQHLPGQMQYSNQPGYAPQQYGKPAPYGQSMPQNQAPIGNPYMGQQPMAPMGFQPIAPMGGGMPPMAGGMPPMAGGMPPMVGGMPPRARPQPTTSDLAMMNMPSISAKHGKNAKPNKANLRAALNQGGFGI